MSGGSRQTLTGTDGMAETIRIGRETGIRVVGTHIKAKGPSSWGHSPKDVLAIDLARAQGVQVYLDQYPFETFGAGPVGVIPVWGFAPPGTDRSGGLDDPKWRRTPGLLSVENLEANLADEATRAANEEGVFGTIPPALSFSAARAIVRTTPGRLAAGRHDRSPFVRPKEKPDA